MKMIGRKCQRKEKAVIGKSRESKQLETGRNERIKRKK